MNESKLGQIFATALKIGIAIAVMIFLGIQSINFFTYVFTAEQEIYAWLGFALTGGAVLVYLAILKWDSRTPLDQFVAISMLLICVGGELLTAGFGMRIQSLEKMGLQFTKTDLDNMILTVQMLALVHAIALITKTAGTDIIEMFKGKDKATAIPTAEANNWLEAITTKRYESTTSAPAEEASKPDASFPERETP
jgi:hypothetical protein